MQLNTTDTRERLTNRLDSITNRAQAIFAEADDAGRDLTEVELGEVTRLAADADKLKTRLDLTDKLGGHDDFLNQSAGRKVPPEQIGNRIAQGQPDLTAKRGTYSALFGKPAAQNNFRDLADFVKSAIRGNDARLMNASMTEGTGASGGFLVPSIYAQDLLNNALEQEAVRPLSTVLPLTSASCDYPIFDYTDRSGVARAGLVMTMIGEGATSTAQAASTKNLKLTAKKGAIFVDVSGELEADVPGFADYLGQAISSAIAGGFDYQAIQGNGAGMGLGMVNSPATVTITKEGSQTAGTIVEANLLNMAGRLHPSCWSRAVWYVSPSALPQLLTLSQQAGPSTGGRSAELTADPNGIMRLMTRPVIITDACSAVGTKGDVILADPSKLIFGLRKDLSIERNLGSGWKEDIVGFRALVRFDIQPAWPSAVTPRAGSTLSAFVVCETRA